MRIILFIFSPLFAFAQMPQINIGKSAGKDMASEKSTYPALIGLDASRDEAHRLTQKAHDVLAIFGAGGQRLQELADYLLARDY